MAPRRLPGASPSPDDVRAEMGRVLASHEFRSSKRSEEFLRFVVENVLTGHVEMLHERTIGIEVFGRSTSYDPSDDATVRVKAGEVRKRLGLYYAGNGRQSRLRIELPSGTYVPEFRLVEPEPEAVVESPVETAPAATPPAPPQPLPVRPRRRYWMAIPALAFVLVAGAAVVYWTRPPAVNPVLEQFWAPVLQGAQPVSLCASFVPDVYALNRDPKVNRAPRPEDFTLLPDQFVGGGDLVAISRIASMLTRMGRAYRVRVGGEVSTHDLAVAPAILVGYSYTRWREISRELRFFIDTSHSPIGVMDNGALTKWTMPGLPPDRHTTEDFAIVTRVFHPDTHAMLVELAGILQYGTDAAGDLVTNPDLLAEALRGAPAGWQQKNVQFVVRVKVISGSPTAPKVVATHFW